MRLLDKPGLIRGEAIIDCVFSGNQTPENFELADIVGLVAAYINLREPTQEMFKIMHKRVGVGLARDMERVFHMFDELDGRSLWSQGPDIADVQFTHRKLHKHYPGFERGTQAILNRERDQRLDESSPF
ncbi:hypothetical protein [Sphingomonas sp. Mn802worker]|uniref:hypothetical protein n=1 Tax=Sphingomonas sp. Mn802worker TaxID=629773 RepID=UPI0012EAD237|nr:hypothetical protein [Sphingomonas sp. Mn802worker]